MEWNAGEAPAVIASTAGKISEKKSKSANPQRSLKPENPTAKHLETRRQISRAAFRAKPAPCPITFSVTATSVEGLGK